MAAYIVRPSEKEWKVVGKILAECGEGAIIIPPAMQQWLKEQGVKADAGSLVDYDFGGEADISVDVMNGPEHQALWALDETLAERINDDLADAAEKPERFEKMYTEGGAEAGKESYQERQRAEGREVS